SGLLAALAVIFSLMAAGYSAFLLGQAKARDLWQSPALLPTLLLHALAAGSAAHLITAAAARFPVSSLIPLLRLLSIAVGVGAALTMTELLVPHVNRDVALVARMILRGRFAARFWIGG